MRFLLAMLCLFIFTACSLDIPDPEGAATDVPSGGGGSTSGVQAQVVQVIDGDTIDVEISGQTYRVRYVGMNTPERDEDCSQEATNANRQWVEGKIVRLVFDTSDTDRFDRLLRYVYVGSTFVNAELVQQGFAEVVLYPPDDAQFDYFRGLEQEAQRANRGCHPTGIFADNTYER